MRTVTKIFICAFVVLLFNLPAMGAGPAKIGVLDMQEFQRKSKTFQTVRDTLKKKFEAMQKKLEEEQAVLKKLEEDYRKQSMMLSLDAQQDKRQALEKKGRYLKYLREDFSEEMKDAEREATKKVGKELEGIVKSIAEKQGFSIILERRTIGLIYYNDGLEITDQVIEAYDKMKMKK